VLGPSQSLSPPPFTAPAVLYKGKRGRKCKRTTKVAESKARGFMGLRLSPILRILAVWRRRGQLSYVHIEWRQEGFIVAFTSNLPWERQVTLPQVAAKNDPPEFDQLLHTIGKILTGVSSMLCDWD
jgi:hypothetical protein